jgi:phospholipid/cholesterol/gamma-HCH transport system substrate-binding protein
VPAHRIIASAAIVAALVAVCGVLLLGSGGGHQYRLHFTHAGLLVGGADVRIGGETRGTVTDLSLTGAGEADVAIKLDRGVASLRAGTTASLEAPSLSGQANRYVSIEPGPRTAPKLPDGSVIPSSATTSVVEIDELYNLLDKRTRDGISNVIRGQRDAFLGRQADAARFYETFAPAVQASDRLFRQLDSDGRSLRRFVVATAQLAHTLRMSSADLQGAVQESAQAVRGFADASQPLERAIALLPSTFSEGTRTLAALRVSLPQFERLIAASRPAFEGLPPFARGLAEAFGQGGAIGDLAALVQGPGSHDDLVEAMRGLPALSSRALPALSSGRKALAGGRPLVDDLRPYMPDLTGLIGNTGRALAPYDANGHYARILPQFGAFKEVSVGGVTRMQPVAPDERILGLSDGNLRRCPGTATAPASDGSTRAAAAGIDCDPSEAP